MAEFFKFLQQNRPDTGLVDRFDLSEIYDSDERLALSNLLLNPDGLDQIYGLSRAGLTKEDIRTMGGLDKPIIHSLGISNWTLSATGFSLSQQITTDKAIGEPSKHSFSTQDYSDNILVLHGGLAAKKIEYNFLDENGELRTTTVPTSRESLFNSSKDAQARYTSASYPGLFRIRRRSHLYELRLASRLLIEKGAIIESPTDTLKIPTYMRTSANTTPSVTNLECYATRNSPLILPIRVYGGASLSLSRRNANSGSPAFVYGWELKRKSDLRTARTATISSAGAVNTVTITISTSGTICDGVDSLLYIYLDPSAVISANLSGLGLTEQAGQDIGLVGFDSLEELDISNNNLSTLPVWLKTLHTKLKRLNIRGNSFWNNGLVQYFDWQEPPSGVSGASNAGSRPNVTLSQVMGYSGWTNSGAITAYDGSYAKVQDSAGTLYKDQRNRSVNNITPLPVVDIANGFRPFTALEELNLGPTIRLTNPDFSVLFPNLRTLNIDTGGQSPRVLYGLIPKMRNNGALMSLNLTDHYGSVGGSIRYLGNTLSWNTADSSAVKQQFIGQFKFSSFNINNGGGGGWFGGICTTDAEVGVSLPSATVDGLPKYSFVATGSAAEAWSGWLTQIQYLGVYYRDIALRIASSNSLTWNKLSNVNCSYCASYGSSNKVKYNASVGAGTIASTDILQAPQLGRIDAWSSGWYGKIFSVAGAPNLSVAQFGANNWEGYEASDGKQFILPTNFADQATSSSYHNLAELYLHNLVGSSSRDLEFREDDLKNLPRISTFYLGDSYFTGKFPAVYTATNTEGVRFNTWFHNCRFRDLSALGSSQTSRVNSIYGPSNGTGVGGSLLPNFSATSNNGVLSYVNLDGTLQSRYPANWHEAGNRGKLIGSLITGTTEETTPSITWTSRNNNNTANAVSEKLYQSSPGTFQIDSQVMVGDLVFSGTTEIGRVTQIDRNNGFIFIDSEVSLSSAALKFRRAGQNISSFFNNHTVLDQVYLQSVKATGSVPQFTNCRSLRFVYLNNNLLTGYQIGTLKNITGVAVNSGSTPALRRFFLEGNALSKETIKNIISEVHDIAAYFKAKNINPNFIIGLYATKYNSSTKEYQNWTRAEIFDGATTITLPPPPPPPPAPVPPTPPGETPPPPPPTPPTPPPQVITIPDPLETKFNQLGPGRIYPGITIQLF